MSSKYTRHQSVVSKQSDQTVDEDSWLYRFQKSLSKDAVQPRSQVSLFDQINTIMNGKSKYTSVEAAVQDMKERSGLTAYLDKISESSEEQTPPAKKKVASDSQQAIDKKVDMTPIVLKKHPPVKKTIENYIRDTKGNLPVPAIIEKIRSIHQADVTDSKDWDDDKLIILVSRLNLGAKRDNPSSFENYNNLGKRDSGSSDDIDPSNSDAFFALNPVKQ